MCQRACPLAHTVELFQSAVCVCDLHDLYTVTIEVPESSQQITVVMCCVSYPRMTGRGETNTLSYSRAPTEINHNVLNNDFLKAIGYVSCCSARDMQSIDEGNRCPSR
ncbi:hypothetical protein TNCV_4172261 [Trichonephila clavipes]|nr:hypothetical protein TNCV_4172261 [Trichonephila clavipes]